MRRFAPVILLLCSFARAADYPAPVEGNYIIKDFKFTTGETLSELRLHYTTAGCPGLYSVNSADDQVTRGHGMHSMPSIWGQYLGERLKESAH